MSNVRMSPQGAPERIAQADKIANFGQETEDPQVLRNLIGQMHGLLLRAEADVQLCRDTESRIAGWLEAQGSSDLASAVRCRRYAVEFAAGLDHR